MKKRRNEINNKVERLGGHIVIMKDHNTNLLCQFEFYGSENIRSTPSNCGLEPETIHNLLNGMMYSVCLLHQVEPSYIHIIQRGHLNISTKTTANLSAVGPQALMVSAMLKSFRLSGFRTSSSPFFVSTADLKNKDSSSISAS